MAKLDDIQALMNQAQNASEPQGEQKTITEGAGNQEVKEKKKRTPKEVKDQSTLFMEHNIGNGNHVTVDSIAGKLMRVNSKISEIAGFIVPASPRFDIIVQRSKVSKKEETDRFETRINIKDKFSQQIKGVVLNYSAEIVARINEEKANRDTTSLTGTVAVKRPDGTVAEVPRKTAEVYEMEADTLAKSTKILGYQEFIQWVIDYCWFEIQESPAIFWSHKERRTSTKDGVKSESEKFIKTPADLKSSQSTAYQLTSKYEEVIGRYKNRAREAAGQVTKSGKPKTVKQPTLRDIFPLSSRYRGRKLAIPGNFIAIKKYEHITVKGSYSPEEQAEMNKKYIREGFSVNNATSFQNKLNAMTAESKERVSIDANGDVTSSQFFAANNSLVANQEYLATIPRWWGKVDTINHLDMRLVRKSEVEVKERKDKNGATVPAYKKYVLDFVQFGNAGNTLSNPEYANIVAATDSRLTDGDVTKFIASLSTSSNKNSNTRGGINYDVTVNSAQDIIASLDALAKTINA